MKLIGRKYERQLTYHMFKGDIDDTKHYVGLQEADAEVTEDSAPQKNLPFVAPFTGKLLKIFLRASSDLSAKTYTWTLETLNTSQTSYSAPNIIGTQSGAGCSASNMATYDFTYSLDSGTNVIGAGDMVHLAVECNTTTPNVTYGITCLWEWNLS